MKSTSVRIEDATAKGLDQLAQTLDRSRSWLINDALKQYLAQHDWMTEAIETALRDADAGGEFAAHDAVMARLDARLGATGPSED